jgi:hypothetical protein
MKVSLDDVLDPEAVGFGIRDILIDVALRIDYRRFTFGADHVRSVCETPQIKLFEIHFSIPYLELQIKAGQNSSRQ